MDVSKFIELLLQHNYVLFVFIYIDNIKENMFPDKNFFEFLEGSLEVSMKKIFLFLECSLEASIEDYVDVASDVASAEGSLPARMRYPARLGFVL